MQVLTFIFAMGLFLGIFIGQQWAYWFGVYGDSIYWKKLSSFLPKDIVQRTCLSWWRGTLNRPQ